jgi:hypothetical protein
MSLIALRLLRDGFAIREQIFRTLPIRIGRDATADFAIADASVSRHHATVAIDAQDGLVIIDGSGTNGLYAGPKRVAREKIPGRLRARLGVVEIEIEEVSASATQPITIEDLHRLDQRRTPVTWAKYIVITLIAMSVETVLSPEFWSPWNNQAAVSLVWQTMAGLVAILVFGAALLGMLKAAGRKVRFADVLHHFAVYSWLSPVAAVLGIVAYYILSDGPASAVGGTLATLATVAFLARAAAIRRLGPNHAFLLGWALVFLALDIGAKATQSYAARLMGQPAIDHSMYMPAPVVGSGPAQGWDAYATEVEQAGGRSAERAAETKP